MPRIAGVDVPAGKKTWISLQYIYGIGPSLSKKILSETGIDPDKRAGDLSEEEMSRLREYVDRECKVEGELRKEVSGNISRLMEIGCYRGLRHRHRLPVRGQRTRTNARTKRGPRQTVAGRGRRRGLAKK
ncbi:MAG: 30S ribosomal protein S13 [Chloroflexi bacterium]|nr:MAG: 30S ribosomal protein S13 [Chloroflexota bacterium]RLC97216.1 MAG: 30S ribosomal protein S13 [Chloroflexota bacterium]